MALIRGRLFLLFSCSLLLHSLHRPSIAGPVAVEFLRPNFTATYLDYVDNSGVFLQSATANFNLALVNPGRQTSRYYVSVLHVATGAIVWTANPSAPLTYSSLAFSFTSSGLSVATSNSSDVRLTPPIPRPTALLRLLASGELLLLDAANASLWSSFEHPTDTLLPGQLLAVSSSSVVALSSSVSDSDLSPGDYRLVLTSSDALLRWLPGSQLYWTLSTDLRAIKNSNSAVAYMAVNDSGLYLLAADKKTAVFQIFFTPSSGELRFAKLDPSGRLTILRYSSNKTLSSSTLETDFVVPANDCDLPLKCGSLGLCTDVGNGSTCSCPTMFEASVGGCSLADGSILANSSLCNGGIETTSSSSPVNYVALDSKINYFGNRFAVPTTSDVDGSYCRNLCSANCSCLGYFYKNSSRSCYLVEHQLGSLSTGDSASTTTAGFLRITKSPVLNSNSSSVRLVIILVPAIASFILLFVLGFIGFRQWKRRRHRRGEERKRANVRSNGRQKPWPKASEFADVETGKDDNEFSIPGLPTRFSYAELNDATGDFAACIGSGGFGSVYKGELSDKSLVAVKKVNNIGLQGKREFCTEIAVISNIHHVNLVMLRGYCLQGAQRMLVYEYMNRGSLDRSLFGACGPLLEWQERMDIAVGSARGLAYLHSGCVHKIIHCDVKPENILLHDHNQVKIADFGMSKLLSPEQSGLFTAMRGTRGYLAPEWLTNSPITDKADVYSFGMVLLEIVRGSRNRSEEREPIWMISKSSRGPAPMYFPSMALKMHELGRYVELADPRLEGRVTGPEIERVVKLALCCLHEEPALRPNMATVAGTLEGTRSAPEPKVELLSTLRLYGRGFGSDPMENEEFIGSFKDSNGSPATRSTSAPLLSCMSSRQLSGPR